VSENGLSNQAQSLGSAIRTSPTALKVISAVTMFVCTNSAPRVETQNWPFSAREVLVPCAGKLQPEHLLKAFEAGADLVCVVACDGDNCHTLEGSRRAQRRVEFVRRLLDETGVGGERLLLFHLPGSAREGMEAGETADRLADLSREIVGKLKELGVSPLRRNAPPT
jgi:F420-non-reducing hydrogenase iron-sulfur subunit